jgi:hypothetical protein
MSQKANSNVSLPSGSDPGDVDEDGPFYFATEEAATEESDRNPLLNLTGAIIRDSCPGDLGELHADASSCLGRTSSDRTLPRALSRSSTLCTQVPSVHVDLRHSVTHAPLLLCQASAAGAKRAVVHPCSLGKTAATHPCTAGSCYA